MSNAFTNWLSTSNSGYRDGAPILKDYQHASRLFLDNDYAKSPKVGFLYFVSFNINKEAIINKEWENKHLQDFGLLVKKVDLPKFKISTETLNQYNRKTVVQTKLNYDPVNIEFHDDNSDIVNGFWVNYYKYYYLDSNYGGASNSGPARNQSVPAFSNTKYGKNDYQYGRYPSNATDKQFLSSIDIYVLHQQQFTQITLVNPKITEWGHDSLNYSEGGKILQNRMGIAYENVLYNQGQILAGNSPEGFAAVYYDKTPSPLTIGGNPINQPTYNRPPSTFDQASGTRAFQTPVGLQSTFDRTTSPRVFPTISPRQRSEFDQPGKPRVFGTIGGNYRTSNPIKDIASILLQNQLNRKGLGRASGVGYNIAGGILGALGSAGAGKYSEPPSTQNQPGIVNLPGGIGVNIFKGLNKSVDGKTRVNPAAIIFPKSGGNR